MQYIVALFVTALLVLQPGCAAKPEADPSTVATQDEAIKAALAAQDEGIVCEHIVRVGSRIARKVCTTAAQRQAQEEKGRKYVEHVQRRAR